MRSWGFKLKAEAHLDLYMAGGKRRSIESVLKRYHVDGGLELKGRDDLLASIVDWGDFEPSARMRRRDLERMFFALLPAYTGEPVDSALHEKARPIVGSLRPWPNQPLALLYHYVRNTVVGRVFGRIAKEKRYNVAPRQFVADAFKKVSESIKRVNCPEGHLYQDWHMSLGFVEKTDSMVEGLALGLKKDLTPSRPPAKGFRRMVADVIRECVRFKPEMNFEEWLRSAPFDTEGSLTGYDYEDSRLTKKGIPLAMTPEEVMEEIRAVRPYKHKVVLKPDEPYKVRLIYSSDWREYVLGNFMLRHIQPTGRITVGASPEVLGTVHRRWIDILGRKWLVPLDYSGFDKLVTKEEVLITIEELTRRFSFGALYMRNLRASSIRSVVPGFEQDYAWVNGLPSGIAFTAVVGSIVNLTWLRLAGGDGYAQGDDAVLEVDRFTDAVNVIHNLQEMQLDVNPAKFFIDKWRTEFLRIQVSDRGLNRYAMRQVNSVAYRKPLARGEPDKVSYMQSVGRNLLDVISRGLTGVTCPDWFDLWRSGRSIEGGAGSDGRTVMRWVTTKPADKEVVDVKDGWVPEGRDPEAWLEYKMPSFASSVVRQHPRSEGYVKWVKIQGKGNGRVGPAAWRACFGCLKRLDAPFPYYHALLKEKSERATVKALAQQGYLPIEAGKLCNRFPYEYVKGWLNGQIPLPHISQSAVLDEVVLARDFARNIYWAAVRDLAPYDSILRQAYPGLWA